MTHIPIMESMPRMGFGTFRLSEDECKVAVLEALRLGVRHIDTASVYRNETAVGEALRESGVPRDQVFLVTKLQPRDSNNVSRACKHSLRLLNVSYIDLYLVHWPGIGGVHAQSLEQQQSERARVWSEMISLQRDGLCKKIGVSNYLPRHLEPLMSMDVKPFCNQIEYHALLKESTREIVRYCKERDIKIVAYSPLAQGLPELLENDGVMKIAKIRACTPAQVALAWTLARGADAVIPRTAKLERIAENTAAEHLVLDHHELEVLDHIQNEMRCCWDPNTVA